MTRDCARSGMDGGWRGTGRTEAASKPASTLHPTLPCSPLSFSSLSLPLSITANNILNSGIAGRSPPVPLLYLTSSALQTFAASSLPTSQLDPLFSAPLLVYPHRYHGCSLRCLARYCLRYTHITLLVPLAPADCLCLSRLCRFQVLISPTFTPLRPTLEPPATSASKLTTVTLQSDGIGPI
jgi:hypothetical protein